MYTLDSTPETEAGVSSLRNGKGRQTATSEISGSATSELRVLVIIASYGNGNDPYLFRLIDEYSSMRSRVDIVVLSNIPRDLGTTVEVRIGLPSKDPWSLPFGHKQLMADRLQEYDLFIYSEDDTLITQSNIDAFLRASSLLPEHEVPGFLRYETGADGAIFYPDVHRGYHWDTRSVKTAGDSTFAFFTNEHAAVFMLTRTQLNRAIDSGGFLVGPHKGPYDLLVSAATDPYTQCGLTKLICISELESFLIPHLPNKYVGTLGLDAGRFDRQVKALLAVAAGDKPRSSLFIGAVHAGGVSQSEKSYYEPIRRDLISMIPDSARRILSIGCGWGATEEALAREGKTVVAVPLDSTIGACIDDSLVRTVHGDLPTAVSQLAEETFDCLLISNVLHLFDHPGDALLKCNSLLAHQATVIFAVPNLHWARVLWARLRSTGWRGLFDARSRRSVRATSHRILRAWLAQGGMKLDHFVEVIPEKAGTLCRRSFGLANAVLATELIAVANSQGDGRSVDHRNSSRH